MSVQQEGDHLIIGEDRGSPLLLISAAELRPTQAAMGQPGTKVAELCTELGVLRQTLYWHVGPSGVMR